MKSFLRISCFTIVLISKILSAQGQYAEVSDIKMYYEIHGDGEPVLLLHGGTGAVEHFKFQIPDFSKVFRVIAPETRGHARTTDSEKPLSYELMASDVVGLLDHLKIDSLNVVGWSDGGVIGLHLASSYPQRIKKLVVMGTNYRADGIVPEMIEELKAVTGETIWQSAIDRYNRYSPNPEHWPVFFEKLIKMWLTQPNFSEAELGKITHPTLIISGDHDLIRLEHTVKFFQSIPKAQLCIVPNATHAALWEKPKLLNQIIIDFLQNDD